MRAVIPAVLDSPRADEVLRGDHFELRGRVDGVAVREVLLLRPSAPALRVAVEAGRFAARVPLARTPNGRLSFELWALTDGKERVRLLTRVVRVRRVALGGVALGELVGGALRKAWVALREGRLPASPRHWLRNLRMHYGELQAHAPVDARGETGRAAPTSRRRGPP